MLKVFRNTVLLLFPELHDFVHIILIYGIYFAAENTPSPQTKGAKQGGEVEPSPDQPEDDTRKDFIGPMLEKGGATDVAPGNEGDEDDPCRSEGIVRFIIPNFSKLSEQILSGPTYIRNLPWLVYAGI